MIYLLRAPPGFGKSWWIERNLPRNTTICSANHWFEATGEYRFIKQDLHFAHGACLQKYVRALQGSVETIAVDNTNVSLTEISPYIALAEAFGRSYRIIRLECDVPTAARRNIHGVDYNKVGQMAANMESLPPFWRETRVMGK